MQLSRKQTILIAVLSGVVLLLTVAAALLFAPGGDDGPAEPTASPVETAVPAPTPAPTDTPEPTIFLLPLVPQWDTPRPTAEPTGAGVFAPQTSPPGTAGPLAGADDEHTRDILAVGLREGRTAALLLLRLSDDALTVLALPADPTPLGGGTPEEQGERAALAAQTAGVGGGAWLALDLGCLPAVLAVTGPLGDRGGEVASPEDALTLLTEAALYIRRASLLKLPALKRAAGDSFASNLTTRELWSLFWTVRGGITVRALLLAPGETAGGS